MHVKGSYTALITPFRNGQVDEAAYQKLVAWQINEGTDGLVPCGTTGESPTLSHTEHRRVVELCVEAAEGKAVVMAGAGSNSTEEAISLTCAAQNAGADAVLSVVPYYNRPTQEGLYAHFRAVHDASELPIFIYNIPGRSAVDLSVDTLKRLAELPRIAGVKDATADLARPLQTRLTVGADFCQLSGEDITALPFLAQGGHGCISVTSNIAPRLCADMHQAWMQKNIDEAMRINEILAPLHEAIFVQASPAPVKFAAALLGLCSQEIRLPLIPVDVHSQGIVKDALKQAGLL